ncbi:TlyA family RNA methyltransferase [Boudabousia marimammalium]|uniref:TlyA family rRNA (Cytidine-2'-O)-methyltransferase n=1 Tax=Boudabousia marimammalium TaxID=156892 RepID=A0A1Q5PRK9_9ACTO|nr:TlyA family RNA methyltransferase [Boudabousia marimammalium]OKL50082.1 TlyA family rRNA (cytidine-2'-O)-methyltransferase [Boudabousia marimammalium]
MAKLARLDTEMVRRKLAHSRAHAQELIQAGRVKVSGMEVFKSARQINPAEPIFVIESDEVNYVSRGAHKLVGALNILGSLAPQVQGRNCLDAGASTGGFTDVLLRRGAKHVVAADVGYGQLAWKLQSDPRVTVLDRTNVRTLTPEQVGYTPELVVGDLSFISLTLILPALVKCGGESTDYLLMVKPQFEIGKERLGSGGVVRNLDHHVETVLKVANCAHELGLDIYGVAASPLPGPAGNVEYFLAMRKQHPQALAADEYEAAIRRAVAQGPAGDNKSVS